MEVAGNPTTEAGAAFDAGACVDKALAGGRGLGDLPARVAGLFSAGAWVLPASKRINFISKQCCGFGQNARPVLTRAGEITVNPASQELTILRVQQVLDLLRLGLIKGRLAVLQQAGQYRQ
jgi:hypothetical protein